MRGGFQCGKAGLGSGTGIFTKSFDGAVQRCTSHVLRPYVVARTVPLLAFAPSLASTAVTAVVGNVWLCCHTPVASALPGRLPKNMPFSVPTESTPPGGGG